MGETCEKGHIGEAMVIADLTRRGYTICLPMTHNSVFDLIAVKDNKLERIQCKYTVSTEQLMEVACRSASEWVHHKYTAAEIDWIAVYDDRTEQCYYIPASLLGDGRAQISLRFETPKNGQKKGIRWAKDFQSLVLNGGIEPPASSLRMTRSTD